MGKCALACLLLRKEESCSTVKPIIQVPANRQLSSAILGYQHPYLSNNRIEVTKQVLSALTTISQLGDWIQIIYDKPKAHQLLESVEDIIFSFVLTVASQNGVPSLPLF